MRTKRVNRYYCDFCKKSGCSGGHIRKHERGCTRNPDRVCGMCAKAKLEQKPTPALLDALCTGAGVEAVLELSQGCPACVMAAIHALRKDEPLTYGRDDGDSNHIEFDYREAAKKFWERYADMEYAY
jgi:hypothetical protein